MIGAIQMGLMSRIRQIGPTETASQNLLCIKRPHSLLRNSGSKKEIWTKVDNIKIVLLVCELSFTDVIQMFIHRVMDYIQENGMYRHEIKKQVNQLKAVSSRMNEWCHRYDRDITIEECDILTKHGSYARDFYDDGGSFLNKLQIAFRRNHLDRIMIIRLDNRELAKVMETKHPELAADLLTLIALSQTGIDVFSLVHAEMQKAVLGMGSYKVQKNAHHEEVRAIACNLLRRVASDDIDSSTEEAKRARLHVRDFQEEISGDELALIGSSTMTSLRMEYIEYYLAKLRIDMIQKKVGISQIRNIWFRLGSKEGVREFFSEMKTIRIPRDKDLDAMDVAHMLMEDKLGERTPRTEQGGRTPRTEQGGDDLFVVNTFRRLMVTDDYIRPTEEEEQEYQFRVLRQAARRNGGELSNADLAKAHGTKKAVMEQLSAAGKELNATMRKVKKMKVAELRRLE